MRDFELITISGIPAANPAIAIAASKAGALGVLDLAYEENGRSAPKALARLAKHGRGALGVRLDGCNEQLFTGVLANLPSQVGTVILVPRHSERLRPQIEHLQTLQLRTLLEATSLEEALLGEELGVAGIIAKGHEAAGRVGEQTTFILLQQLLGATALPVFAQGGIGLHTAAACYAAGAAGVVLDSQLLLAAESPLPPHLREVIERMDGSETVCLKSHPGESFRIYRSPGSRVVSELQYQLDAMAGDDGDEGQRRALLAGRVGMDGHNRVWPLGQDACFARPLANRFRTVRGILRAIQDSADDHIRAARRQLCLGEDSPLALSHGTRFPILQGPMTRVSDKSEFAVQVARAGALPFLALALMRGPEVDDLLTQTSAALGDRPWGVGILGFVPLELREEQLEVVARHKPSFAIIAGGRPDQALALEDSGIRTYLHVPSPGLLKLYLEAGARRFIFEGRECGGHVGPRSSFVLWDTMILSLLEQVSSEDLQDCHVVFAGGIHDSRSAAMVSASAATLADAGAKVGVLLGTAYLFTTEAVATGAIVEGMQARALGCEKTVLLETGPGHETRCAETAFFEDFEVARRRMQDEGGRPDEIKDALETLNLGRLRIASKGLIRRESEDGAVTRLVSVGQAEQRRQGMYMMGQLASLRSSATSMEELHRQVSTGSTEWLGVLEEPELRQSEGTRRPRPPKPPADVAIIGMACLLPQAPDLATYWHNILNKVDAITEVPAGRWDWRKYFDPDQSAPDKVYSRWGGFLDDVAFDPAVYGIPPSSLPSIEPLQLLTLEVVQQALGDAGYLDREFDRKRASVILGVGGGVADLGQSYALRSGLPMIMDEVPEELYAQLPEWTEDSFAGILLNVAAGRVANRFDLCGVNYTVDAACASSLAAIHLAVRELEVGSSDLVIAGGADTVQNPFGYLAFSKTHALSPTGRCRTFDAAADGIAISEGVAIVVLKRLADAERDGDRIYAVIKGVGGSSDGRALGLTAPHPEGQALALERAYENAGFSPATVSLVEAHGTGTVAGDAAELETLREVFERAGSRPRSCAVGSVKSMIGHTKCAAGVAGLIKVAQGLHNKVLPPTINVDHPIEKANSPDGPFYVSKEVRPWVKDAGSFPRRAGVSAFGFGGTNFHVALEEHEGFPASGTENPSDWPSELLLFTGESSEDLLALLKLVSEALNLGALPNLADLAFSLWHRAKTAGGRRKLALVATSPEDLQLQIEPAIERLTHSDVTVDEREGPFFLTADPFTKPELAFLFPGQGSQYPDMLIDLAVRFPEVRESLELADKVLAAKFSRPLSSYLYPPPAFSVDGKLASERLLTQTQVAQPAIGAVSVGCTHLLEALGLRPAMTAGHSYGEYVALYAAGVFSETELYEISEARGRFMAEAAAESPGCMAAVTESSERVESVIGTRPDVWIANLNGPRQTVISGTRGGVANALELLTAQGFSARMLNVSCGFHTPIVEGARERLAAAMSSLRLSEPDLPIFSNMTAGTYPAEPEAIASLLGGQMVSPVRFVEEVEAMYAAGARVFLEVGPKDVLTGLVGQTLKGRPHLALAIDNGTGPGLKQLQLTLGRLAVHGIDVNLDRLFEFRSVRLLDLSTLEDEGKQSEPASTTWMVNGGRVRPLGSPPLQPRQAPAVPTLPAPPAQIRQPSGWDDAAQVMISYQRLMTTFLETQREVMSSYLTGKVSSAAAPPGIAAPGIQPDNPAPPEPTLTGYSGAQPPDQSGNGVEPASQGTAPDQTTPDEVMTRLLAVVGERTGYPPGMLKPELDIEADLGIDSIKRVEIMGTLVRSFTPEIGAKLQQATESLVRIKTLKGLASSIAQTIGGDSDQKSSDDPPAPPLPRSILRSRKVPWPEESQEQTRGTYLLTEDESGVADSLAGLIEADGGRVAKVRIAQNNRSNGHVIAGVDLTDPNAVQQLVESIRRRHGPIAALIHLLPLRSGSEFDDLDSQRWRSRLNLETGSLFHLAKAARADLQSSDADGGLILAATCLSCDFGKDNLPDNSSPTQGAIAGLIKCVALEWPGTRCKVVHTDPTVSPEEIAKQLFAEIKGKDPTVEVAHGKAGRLVVKPTLAPLVAGERVAGERVAGGRVAGERVAGGRNGHSGPVTSLINSESVILVTGGARGVTAQICRELAQRYRPRLVLVGRSALPAHAESSRTAGLTSISDLKSALIAQLTSAGDTPDTHTIESAYSRLLMDREIRSNLLAMEQTGATVEYIQQDVRDSSGLESLVARLYRSHGRLDGVIHGAGIIEDKLLVNKSYESFQRVVDTKVAGAFALAKAVRPESLSFLVFFSSVAGCFGNRGQSDYAAANEILNKLAIHLNGRWPGRVVSINWGPWESGMVSSELLRVFSERGITPVTTQQGRESFCLELEAGNKIDAEVILGDGLWNTSPRRRPGLVIETPPKAASSLSWRTR